MFVQTRRRNHADETALLCICTNTPQKSRRRDSIAVYLYKHAAEITQTKQQCCVFVQTRRSHRIDDIPVMCVCTNTPQSSRTRDSSAVCLYKHAAVITKTRQHCCVFVQTRRRNRVDETAVLCVCTNSPSYIML